MKRDDDDGGPDGHDDAAFELEAAAVHLAHGGEADAEMPAHLRARIEAEAPRHVARTNPDAAPRARAAPATTTAAGAQVVVVEMSAASPKPRFDVARWSGWLAAAASIALFVGRALSGSPSSTAPSSNATALHGEVAASPSRAEVAWDDATQRGTLHASGFAPTDGASEYQIWLFRMSDSDRLPTPVGRFVSRATSASIDVPLAAPVRLERPDRLVITREQAGGVLVSKREHVVLEGDLGAR